MTCRVAVVGAGIYGTHVLNVLASAGREGACELVAVAEKDAERLERARQRYQVAAYESYEAMFQQEKPDAVAIVTPDHLHRAVALAAAASRIHILCQKPIATSSRDGLDMIEAAEKAGVLLYVDYHKRFDPAHRALKRDIAQGRLGSILYGDVYMEDRIEVPSVWFDSWAQQSSPAWFLGTHYYDLASWLMASSPCRVWAYGNKTKLQALGIDTYDHISALVVFDNLAAITFHASWVLPDCFPSIVNQQIRLVGSEGICEIDAQDRGMLTSYSGEKSSQVHNPFSKTEQPDPYDLPQAGYTCESILHFLRILRRHKAGESLWDLAGLYPGGKDALTATRLCEAIHESLETAVPFSLA